MFTTNKEKVTIHPEKWRTFVDTWELDGVGIPQYYLDKEVELDDKSLWGYREEDRVKMHYIFEELLKDFIDTGFFEIMDNTKIDLDRIKVLSVQYALSPVTDPDACLDFYVFRIFIGRSNFLFYYEKNNENMAQPFPTDSPHQSRYVQDMAQVVEDLILDEVITRKRKQHSRKM